MVLPYMTPNTTSLRNRKIRVCRGGLGFYPSELVSLTTLNRGENPTFYLSFGKLCKFSFGYVAMFKCKALKNDLNHLPSGTCLFF